jgi:hypothetical protein
MNSEKYNRSLILAGFWGWCVFKTFSYGRSTVRRSRINSSLPTFPRTSCSSFTAPTEITQLWSIVTKRNLSRSTMPPKPICLAGASILPKKLNTLTADTPTSKVQRKCCCIVGLVLVSHKKCNSTKVIPLWKTPILGITSKTSGMGVVRQPMADRIYI